ncbi:uridine kinase [Amycolatopsis sp. PS_44_ISF1]|uniref:uridine kinase family protein n=1 Tax=Amycolatopsis sp. PS_44_ISF1 TaxID=2974917 RepID=UPI0028E00B86|nr:uridine kinase [Amycolatopsis sp. PS_44_ISF1]MDT8910812.1 uridine kinase [Amycolatopsis sp. PS_44_ISF1]
MLAFDGPSGSGKSTAALEALSLLGSRAALVTTDSFATWSSPVSWWPRLVAGVLVPLAAGRSGSYRRTDWSTGVPRPGERVTVEVPEILVLEGVSCGRRSMRPRLSLLCWVEGGTEAERLAAAVARDGEAHRAELRKWQLFERGWFAVDGTRSAAGARIPGATRLSGAAGS